MTRLDTALAMIEAQESSVRAWVDYDALAARQTAAQVDAQRCSLALAGIVVGIKDIIDVAGFVTGCGAKATGVPATLDAYAVAALRAAGAVILGKTVTAEHAYLDPGPTRNPHRLSHSPGGSSSGSAAAVAAGMADLCLGTQTGGSVIRPASYCGVTGFKPSFGRYSLDGVRPLAPSCDTLGILARDIDTIIAADGVLAASVSPCPSACAESSSRIAVCLHPFGSDSDDGSAVALQPIMPRLLAAGFATIDVRMPNSLRKANAAASVIVACEAARLFPKEGSSSWTKLGPRLRELLSRGAGINASEEASARRAIAEACAEVRRWLRTFDALVLPSAPGEAPLFENGTGPSIYNRGITAIGLPCLSLPLSVGRCGLPIGMQLIADLGSDSRLLEIGRRIEATVGQLPAAFPDGARQVTVEK